MKKKMPQVKEVLNSLKAYCQTELENGKMHAFGLVYESELVLEEGQEAVKCISIEIKHKDENEIPMFYQSYTIEEDNEVVYGEFFGVKS